MLKRKKSHRFIQLFLLLVALLACGRLVFFHNSTNGSARDGKIENNQYFLSRGHGHYTLTTQSEFEQLKTREFWNNVAIAVMIADLIVAGVIQPPQRSRYK